ncbi:threonine transporter RhtB [Thalassotalea marina]|uniref:Threonine transporter RhtB n=2 Tax=Thalassotalea marina TaxID=1673741 RepID=A0A919EL49_9GAMM|nr:threonine transporter RhtB [Thalassotalea marina]
MTLAMTLGMSIGVRKTLWMMYGELIGVAIVATASVLGVATVLLNFPKLFFALKLFGACYLAYLGLQMWQSRGKLALSEQQNTNNIRQPLTLFTQGLVTAIANPKGWAFMVSLLPPFINQSNALLPQLTVLIAIILISEFVCMMIYATGGKTIARTLTSVDNVKRLNKVSGSLMLLVALWLLIG